MALRLDLTLTYAGIQAGQRAVVALLLVATIRNHFHYSDREPNLKVYDD